MNVVLWVIAGVLAAAFAGAGAMKVSQPKEKLATTMAWVEDFSPGMVKLIGAAELLGAVGLVLPPLVDVAPVLSPIAAVCLALTMVGAVATHLRRKEGLAAAAPALVLGVLCVVVAWGRFGPYSF